MYSGNRRSGDHTNRTQILEQVTDIFKDQIDADVIKLILDQNDWKVEETIEQLFQLASSATPAASSRKHNIDLAIIACSLLDDNDTVVGSSSSSLPVNAVSNINPEALSSVYPEASSFNSAALTSPLTSVLLSANCDESHSEPTSHSVNESSVNCKRTPTSSFPVSISEPAEASHNNTSVISSTSSFVVSSSVVHAASKDLLLPDRANNVEYLSSAATNDLLFRAVSSSNYSTFSTLDRECRYKTDANNSLLTGDFDPFAVQTTEEVYAELYAELLNSSLAQTSTSTKDTDATYTHSSSGEPYVIHSTGSFSATGLLPVQSEYVTKSNTLEEQTSVDLNYGPTGCTDTNTGSSGSVINSGCSGHVQDKHFPLISSTQIGTDMAGNMHVDKKTEFSSSVKISSSFELAKETNHTGRVDSISSSNSSSKGKSPVSTALSLPSQSPSNISRSSIVQEKTSVPITQSASRLIPGSDHSEVCASSSGHPLAADMGLSPEAPEFVPQYFVPSLVPQPTPQFVTPMTLVGMRNASFSHRPSSSNELYAGPHPARFNTPRPLKPIRPVSFPGISASPQPPPQPLKLMQRVPLPHPGYISQLDMHTGYLPRSGSKGLTRASVSTWRFESLIGANLYHASTASNNFRQSHVPPSCSISKNEQEDDSASKLSPDLQNEGKSSKYASANQNSSAQPHGEAHEGKLPSNKSWSAMAQELPKKGASSIKESWPRQAQEPKGGSLASSSSRSWPNVDQEPGGGNTSSVGSGNLQGVGNGVQMVQNYARSGTKLLVLLRGLPGSGKSYLASAIRGSGEVFTTDDYFMSNGVYEFDQNLLSDAHAWNKQRVRGALDQGVSPVIVDNTNIMMWEMLPYAQMADERGYAVEVLEPKTHWKYKPKHLAKRNSHGVSIESIKRMKDRFQSLDTASLRAHLSKLRASVPSQTQDKNQEKTASTPSPILWLPEKISLRGVPAHKGDTHGVNLGWEKSKPRRQKKTSQDVSHPSRNGYRVLEKEKSVGVNLTLEVSSSARSEKGTNYMSSVHLEHVPANGKMQGSEADLARETPNSSSVENQQEDDSTFYVVEPAIDWTQVEEVDLIWEEPKSPRKRERRLRSRENASDAVDSGYTEDSAYTEEDKSSSFSDSVKPLLHATTNTVDCTGGCMHVEVKQEEVPASPQFTTSNGDDDSSGLNSEAEVGKIHSSTPHTSNSSSDSDSCTRDTEHLVLQASSTTSGTAVKEDSATRDFKEEYVAAFNNSSLALISTMYASSDDEDLIPCASLKDNSTSQETESHRNRSIASPDRQSNSSLDNFGDATLSGSSLGHISTTQDCSPLSPRKKGRTKKHRVKPPPFFDESFKAKLSNIDWRTYNPTTLLPGAQPSTSLISSSTVATEMLIARPDCQEASSQTDVQGFNLMFMETNSLSSPLSVQEGYRCVTARGGYMTTDTDASHSNSISGSMHSGPNMKLDKSTEIDWQLVEVMPDIEILQNCFPEVAVFHLEEVLEICSGNMDWATNLLLDWGVSNPLTAIDREQLREEMALHPEIFPPALAPTPFSPAHVTQPQSLFDLCRNQLDLTQGKELSDEIQIHIIQNSYKRLQDMEKLELLRAQSMSYDENSPECTGFSDDILSLSAFTAASSINSIVHAATGAVQSTSGSMHKGVKIQGVNKLMAAERPSDSLKDIAEEIISGESTPTYSAGSSLKSSQSSSVSDLSNTAKEYSTDETLDYAMASFLQACEEAEREERKRQIEEDEVLARWMESEQDSDNILAGVTVNFTTTTTTTTSKQRSKRNVAVGGIKIQDLSKKQQVPKQQKVPPKPIVSLRNIIAEEEEHQKHHETKLRELEAMGGLDAIATRLKRQKLSQHFPGVSDEFLDGVFADKGYCFEETVAFLESILGGKQAVPHMMVLEQSVAFEEAEEQLVDKAKTRSLLDVSDRVWNVQPVAGLNNLLEERYHELRQKAAVHSIMRKECFFKCQAAHRRKMQGVGDFYSQQGRLHMSSMQLANQQASQMLLKAREQEWRGKSTLDLHGFFTEEALTALRIVINEKVTEYSTHPDRGNLKVITGRGKNSQNKVAKIRPAVLKFLSGNGYRYDEVNEGMLKVWL